MPIEPPWPVCEPARIEKLKSYRILDTPTEPVFDRIARLAAHHFDMPIALVSLLDESRQWFKARHGLEAHCTHRRLAFCAYAILEDRVMVVPDARADERFADNPLVTGAPGIRFYAGAPLRTPEGFLLGTLCVIDRKPHHDFDRERQHELADFAQMVMQELEARVAIRTLETARAEADRANRTKTRFLAAASHDLRQPLQAMELLLGVLISRLNRQEDNLAVALRLQEAMRAGDLLLKGLLDISTLEAGIVRPNVTTFGLDALLGRLDREMRGLAAGKNLHLRVVPCRAEVRSDPLIVECILRNLLVNAVTYTRTGKVLVGARRRGGTLRLEVWDTGPGIPADQLDLIFEDFYQIGNPERDRRLGLGLGLAIAQRQAQLLGHRLGVRSEVGRGSVFFLDLPLVLPRASPRRRGEPEAAPAPDRDAAGRNGKPAAGGATVLVIEDEPQQRLALEILLQSLGWRVVAAAGATEALARMEAAGAVPAAVVSDFRLRNGATGLQAIEEIRERVGAGLPAILITGDTAPERLRQARQSECLLLHKPFAPEELSTALERMMVVA